MNKTFQTANIFKIIVAVAVGIFCFSSLVSLFHPTHFLKTLEPYPDGLLYSLSARNLAIGNGMQLVYQDSFVEHWVPPLYTLVLSLGYVLSANPVTFVVVNTILGALTVWLLGWIVYKTSNNLLATGFALALYLSHAFVLWLPTLPMSENLSVLLLVVGIAGLVVGRKKAWVGVSIALVAALGLVFTRYAAIPIATVLALLSLLSVRNNIKRGGWVILAGILLLGLGLFSWLIASPLTLITDLVGSLLAGDNPFYSLRFVVHNVVGYIKALLGFPTKFLWQNTAFTSLFAFSWLILLPILAWKLKRFRYETVVILSLFLAQFPLMLIFYTLDTRYIIYTLPLIALAAGWSVALLSLKMSRKYLVLGLGVLLLGHALSQVTLYKQIVSDNLLGRSVAWQYEAIKHFDTQFSTVNEASFLITALPPFLVDAYSTGKYRVLPLSPSQEFIAKEQWVWGSDMDPERWMSSPASFRDPLYELASIENVVDDLLVNNVPVYISNAYITHLQEVIADYETWKTKFDFELVATGCDNACDLYRLRLYH